MERLIDNWLLEWKNSPARKPLLLFGARQVGKTYALVNFGESCFDNYIHVDFSRNTAASDCFTSSISPDKILTQLEALTGQTITPNKTLLILDEIQLCERALTSLKYFCEDAPHLHVAAAGSLLGVKLRESGSFPVGKVDMKTLHPLNFEEYLMACGAEKLASVIEECTNTLEFCPLHEEALDKYREYLLVGGMPDVVKNFLANKHNDDQRINQRSFSQAYEVARLRQREIDQAYIADIAKHAPSNLVPRIIDVWKSMPAQLAKENTKFQFKAVKKGGRAAIFEEPVAWLEAVAVVAKCLRVTDPVAPLKTFVDSSSFKLYCADTGVLASEFDALPSDVSPENNRAVRFRGALAENYVMQQFTSADVKPFYWGIPSKQEVDFIARNLQGDILPLEVKSGENVRANSLTAYREKYAPPYVVRLSSKNFGEEKFVKSIPLYAACWYAKSFLPTPAFV